jgi:hypothetical protein
VDKLLQDRTASIKKLVRVFDWVNAAMRWHACVYVQLLYIIDAFHIQHQASAYYSECHENAVIGVQRASCRTHLALLIRYNSAPLQKGLCQ